MKREIYQIELIDDFRIYKWNEMIGVLGHLCANIG